MGPCQKRREAGIISLTCRGPLGTSHLCTATTREKNPSPWLTSVQLTLCWGWRVTQDDLTAPHKNTYPLPLAGTMLAKHMPTWPPNPPRPELWQQRFRLPWLQSFLETSEPWPGWQHPIWGEGGMSQLAKRQKGSREQGPKPAPWYNATQRLKGVRKNRTRGKNRGRRRRSKGAQQTFGTTKKFFTTLQYGHTHTHNVHNISLPARHRQHTSPPTPPLKPCMNSNVSCIILISFVFFAFFLPNVDMLGSAGTHSALIIIARFCSLVMRVLRSFPLEGGTLPSIQANCTSRTNSKVCMCVCVSKTWFSPC